MGVVVPGWGSKTGSGCLSQAIPVTSLVELVKRTDEIFRSRSKILRVLSETIWPG